MAKILIFSFLFVFAFLFAEDTPLKGFNVVIKEISAAGKPIRISPFKGIGVISVNLCFKNAGEKLSPKGKECLVALLKRSIGEATESKSREQLQHYAREHNVILSFDSTDDNFTITGKCPSNKLSELFILIEEVLFHSKFNDKDLIIFKKEILAGAMQAMQSPNAQLEELMKSVILKNHPYGTFQKTYIESLKNISRHDLKSYMRTYFTQDNLLISACGEIDESELALQVSNIVNKLPKKFTGHLPSEVRVLGPYQRYAQKFPIPQTVISLVQEGIEAHHPDFFALQIAMICLGNSDVGVLWQKIREEKGLTYGIKANLSMQKHFNSLSIATFTQTENVEKMIETIRDVIKNVCANGFSEELVKTAKNNFLGNYKRSFSSTSNIASRLINHQLDDRPVNFHKVVIEKISRLSTEDVNEAAKRLLKPDQVMIFTVGQ